MTLLVAKDIAGDRWMDMAYHTDMGKLAYSMETLFQHHFVHHKSHLRNTDGRIPKYRQVSFHTRDSFLKSVTQIKHRIAI